jgi:hypothetical protein
LKIGIQKFGNSALFNSGSESKKHEFGCGFYVSGEFLKYVKDFKIINERICCLRLKAKWFSSMLINVHAPTNKKMGEIKECYNLLEKNINQIARSDIKLILGDFNAKVGKENIYKPTTGNESLHKETNNNRIKIIQFVISKVLNVRCTMFPHKDIHKETWYSADGRTANQTDHVLISNRFMSATAHSRALRGPHIGSDRNLLKINFKVKLRVKTGNKYNEKRKFVNILQNPKLKQEYAIEIKNRFEILENLDEDNIDNNITEKLEIIKTIIKDTKQQLTEKDESTETLKNKWYDEEYKFAIEMKKAREKWLIKGRRERRKSRSMTIKEKMLTK